MEEKVETVLEEENERSMGFVTEVVEEVVVKEELEI